MPPRLRLRPFTSRSSSLRQAATAPAPSSVCLICSLAPHSNATPRVARRRTVLSTTRRTLATATAPGPRPSDGREELQRALQGLQKHAARYVSLPRVQLALSALREEAGDEAVRVAVLGGGNAAAAAAADAVPGTAKELLRLLLADPLSPEQEWERALAAHDATLPLIVRVGANAKSKGPPGNGSLTYTKGGLLKEMDVSSPGLNGHRLEILFMETKLLSDALQGKYQGLEEVALSPTVEIPTSRTRQCTPSTTPVHKALLVGDGLIGAASLMNLPVSHDTHGETIAAVVQLPGFEPNDARHLPFCAIDINAGRQGLDALRQSLERSSEYQKMWYKSNIPNILEWLKEGIVSTEDGTTKQVVRGLIASLLRNALNTINDEEERKLGSAISSQADPAAVASLNKALAEWSEKAHAELQVEMDKAFQSRRWSKLNWWKLFWRVDDVGVLSAEMLSQRFLPRAERNAIYLAGQVEGSGLFGPGNGRNVYSIPTLLSAPRPRGHLQESTVDVQPAPAKPAPRTRWPTHITFTRNYLLSETVPALQALAQKLVIQSASFSTLTSGLGALMYLSSFGLYESGAVAAFGLVWSLRGVQKKWEAARAYWQSEIREEGRKAVRAVEISVAEALDGAVRKGDRMNDAALRGELQSLKTARELVNMAEEALKRMK